MWILKMTLSPLSIYIMAFAITHVLGGTWDPIGLEIVDELGGDGLGGPVSLNSDGTIVAIVAPTGSDLKGNVGVWEYDGSDDIWEQRGDDIVGEVSEDLTGFSIALSKDGDVVAIGAPGHDTIGDCDCEGTAGLIELTVQYLGESTVDIDFSYLRTPGPVEHGVTHGDKVVCNFKPYINEYFMGVPYATVRVQESGTNETNETLCAMHVPIIFCYSIDIGTYGCDGTLMISGWKDGNGKECSFASDAGQTRIFEYKTEEWTQRGRDINGEFEGDASGFSVALSDNGDVIAIGSPHNAEGAGHVRIYEWAQRGKDIGWMQRGEDIDGDKYDSLGKSVSLSSDGNIVAIAGRKQMRVYKWMDGGWKRRGDDIPMVIYLRRLIRDKEYTETYESYEVSSALNSNGDIVAFASLGYVRVFEYDEDEEKWEKRGDDLAVIDYPIKRLSVSLSSDGDTVAVGGVEFTEYEVGIRNVRVYVYDADGWKQRGDDIDAVSASLSSDGNVIAVKAYPTGNVRVYEYESGCDAVDIDVFLGSCSTLWDDNTVDIATIEDDIASLQADLSALKDDVHKRFQAVSNPVINANSVGGGLDTFGDADTFLGVTYNNAVLLISLITNFILITVGCCIMCNVKKHKDYSLVVQSDE
eukprot:388871_1